MFLSMLLGLFLLVQEAKSFEEKTGLNVKIIFKYPHLLQFNIVY